MVPVALSVSLCDAEFSMLLLTLAGGRGGGVCVCVWVCGWVCGCVGVCVGGGHM